VDSIPLGRVVEELAPQRRALQTMKPSNLRLYVTPEDYQVFAGPDWPTYENLTSGIPAELPHIQQEVEKFISMMIQTYNELTLDGTVVAEENQKRQNQTFYDKKFTNNKICRVPWETMGVNANGEVFICSSPSWVPKFVGNLSKEDNVFNILKSKTAQQIRQEILAGRYYYCNNKICIFFSKNHQSTYSSTAETIQDLEPLEFKTSPQFKINQIPKNLIFDFDYTCNFKCPSCRTEFINNNKHHIIRPINKNLVEKIKTLVIDKINTQPIEIRWCGGEPFISEPYLDLLEYIIGTGKTNIRHIIQTNGSYLKSKSDLLSKLLPVITELRISFDAATPDTYQKVRVIGVWNTLLDNV
jgi:sulfatase maturation enzyme AslB (radical SAM superfamily)